MHAGVLGEPAVDTFDADILDGEPMDRVQVHPVACCLLVVVWLDAASPAAGVPPTAPLLKPSQHTRRLILCCAAPWPAQVMLEEAQRLHNL